MQAFKGKAMSEDLAPVSETEQVEILATPTPRHVEAWRKDAMPERSLYPSNAEFGTVVPDDMFAGASLPAEKRQAAVRELRGMLADTGLSPADASALLMRSAHVRADGKTEEQQRREARTALAKHFSDPDAAMADVRKLVARDPRFSKFLVRKGLGNDTETILTLARAARSQRLAGKLK
jgi:hypothetical protein